MTVSHADASAGLRLDLIRKYSVQGPRYTSYPPATQFTPEFGAAETQTAVEQDNRPGAGPVSLYFHLPFCETRCWFCGCNTVITLRRESAADYVQDLEREVRLVAPRLDPARPVTQIHLGGGTPTFLPPDVLLRMGELIQRELNVARDCEFSVEIDPRRLTVEHVAALAAIGANRASLGVQDTDVRVQVAIHRIQPQEDNRRACGWLREHGFASVNVDLIYGLPLQTEASFCRTIEDVLGLGPDRLSLFSYAHVPWIKPSQRIFEDRRQLPGPEEKLAMFAEAHRRLTGAGFVDIGLDHFARPGDPLAVAQRGGTLHRNFQGYSTQAGASLYGFGVSAISSTSHTYRQNLKSLPEWRAALLKGDLPVERGLRLTEDDRRSRAVIMGLMCQRQLQFAAIARAHGIDFALQCLRQCLALEDLQADGLVHLTTEGLEVTPLGVPLLRVIAQRFDPLFAPAAGRHALAI
jgi:oxygen-independent coproporphyrinogen-3 oxidase